MTMGICGTVMSTGTTFVNVYRCISYTVKTITRKTFKAVTLVIVILVMAIAGVDATGFLTFRFVGMVTIVFTKGI